MAKGIWSLKWKMWWLDVVFYWITTGADELDGPFLFLSSYLSMPDYGIRGHSKAMFLSIEEQGIFKWEGGTRDKKAAFFVLYFIKVITTSQWSKRDAIFFLCRERDLKGVGQVSLGQRGREKLIKINPANSLISFSFPAMQMFAHNSVSDAVSRLLRWFIKTPTSKLWH